MAEKITIVEDFTGYPDGKKKRRFVKGEEPKDLPEKFVDLIVEKGHAVRGTAKSKGTKE